MNDVTKVSDVRLECIASGAEDYDTEEVISMAAELWKLRGENQTLLQELTDIRPVASKYRAANK